MLHWCSTIPHQNKPFLHCRRRETSLKPQSIWVCQLTRNPKKVSFQTFVFFDEPCIPGKPQLSWVCKRIMHWHVLFCTRSLHFGALIVTKLLEHLSLFEDAAPRRSSEKKEAELLSYLSRPICCLRRPICWNFHAGRHPLKICLMFVAAYSLQGHWATESKISIW